MIELCIEKKDWARNWMNVMMRKDENYDEGKNFSYTDVWIMSSPKAVEAGVGWYRLLPGRPLLVDRTNWQLLDLSHARLLPSADWLKNSGTAYLNTIGAPYSIAHYRRSGYGILTQATAVALDPATSGPLLWELDIKPRDVMQLCAAR